MVRADGAEEATGGPGAKEAARVVREEYQRRARLEHQQKVEREQDAQLRFRHAYHDIRMEHEKDALCLQLEELTVEDRKRRQALIEGDKSNVPREAQAKQQFLSRFFEKEFTHLGLFDFARRYCCCSLFKDEDVICTRVREMDDGSDEENQTQWTGRSLSPKRTLSLYTFQ